MNFLPEDVIIKIYRYKHELEFKHVLDQLVDNNKNDCYFSSISKFRRYLLDNIDNIECVILNDRRRIDIFKYLRILNRRNKIFFYFILIYLFFIFINI